MELGILGKILENAKEKSVVTNFVKELSNYLENMNQSNNKNLNEIEKECKLTYDSSCLLVTKRNEILKEYAIKSQKEIQYISYKNEDKGLYQIIELNKKGEQSSFYLPKTELPENIEVDKIIKKQGDKYKIDEETTKEIIEKIQKEAEKIANMQNEKLNKYRQENILYQVVDFGSKGIYLQNTKTNEIFEEPNLEKEIINKISTDAILSYKSGKYQYEEELTDKYIEGLIAIKENKTS